MIPFQALAQTQHIEDLRAEAKAERLARSARQVRRNDKPRSPRSNYFSFLPGLRNWPYAAR